MRSIGKKAVLVLFGAFIVGAAARGEIVERIAAVVGDRIILASEVASQVQLYMMQAGRDADLDLNQLADDILDEMVNDALILSAAEEDTTIVVSDGEVESALNEHIASLVARFPSEEAFLEQLRMEGWTKRSYERRLRTQISEQLKKEKIIARKLSDVSVSRQEVEEFYEAYADSLPDLPVKVRLAHILVGFEVSPKTDDSLRLLAEEAREKAVDNGDFVALAAQYGDEVIGGRIGFVKRRELVPEFARAAFSLRPGSISGPVRTEYGWHIIKSHYRYGDSVDVSQVLFPAIPSAADSARARFTADSLYQEILAGADFKELAKLNSDDDATRATGGEMEEMTLNQLRPEFVTAIEGLTEGEISPPVSSARGYHIIRLLEKREGRPMNLEDDFDIVRRIASQEKTSRMVEEWVDKLKEKVYVDIRDINLVD